MQHNVILNSKNNNVFGYTRFSNPLIALLSLAIIFVITTNFSIANDPRHKNGYKIGALLPLSGNDERLGKNMLAAMYMALIDLKAENYILIPIDSELPAEQIMVHIIENKVDIIIGPAFSKDVQKISGYIDTMNKCFISFSNDRTLSGSNCLFLMGFMPEESINRVVLYATDKGYTIYGLLPDNQYGHIVAKQLKLLANADRINLKGLEFYNQSPAHNAQDILNKIQASGSDNNALIIPELDALKKIMPLLKNSKIKLIGSNQWENESLYTSPNLQGSWFASAPKKYRDKFELRFLATYQTKPLKISSLAYDATAFVYSLSNEHGKVSKTAITDSKGFFGITGAFKFLSDGSNERKLSIFEIKDGKIVEIDLYPVVE